LNTTVISTDAIELIAQLNVTTRDQLLALMGVQKLIEDVKLQTVRSPVLRTKEAAAYIGMSEQYLSQGRSKGATGKGTPPPNCIEIYGARGDGDKPTILYEIAELDRWLAAAPRRFSEESQERRRKEHAS
jgi:hypothetical protein